MRRSSAANNEWIGRHLESLHKPLNPTAPAMPAAALGDRTNRWVANIAAKVRADNVAGRLPSFFGKNHGLDKQEQF